MSFLELHHSSRNFSGESAIIDVLEVTLKALDSYPDRSMYAFNSERIAANLEATDHRTMKELKRKIKELGLVMGAFGSIVYLAVEKRLEIVKKELKETHPSMPPLPQFKALVRSLVHRSDYCSFEIISFANGICKVRKTIKERPEFRSDFWKATDVRENLMHALQDSQIQSDSKVELLNNVQLKDSENIGTATTRNGNEDCLRFKNTTSSTSSACSEREAIKQKLIIISEAEIKIKRQKKECIEELRIRDVAEAERAISQASESRDIAKAASLEASLAFRKAEVDILMAKQAIIQLDESKKMSLL